MEELQVTTAPSHLSASASEMPAKLSNFPLPRELRDNIYSYLLDGDYTRLKRTVDKIKGKIKTEFDRIVRGENAYHFHTNILAVNRAIHEEAEELLYKRNIFIVLSYQWPGVLDMTGGWFWLMTVSKKHVAKMTRHSLRIHTTPGANHLAELSRKTGQKAPVESCIILARDLEAFCLTFLIPASSTSGPAITVTTSPAGVVDIRTSTFDDRKAESMQLRCDLRDSKYRPMSAALQRSLLAPLAAIMAPCQRVVFTGEVLDVPQTESLKRTMAPSLKCQSAVFWAYFEALTLAKQFADVGTDHDDISFVLTEYLTLEGLSFDFVGKPAVYYELSTSYPRLFEAITIFHFELLITIACIRIKLRDEQRFGTAVESAKKFLAMMSQGLELPEGFPDGLMAYYDNIVFWANLAGREEVVDKLPIETSTREFRGLVAGQHGPHQAHDLSLLENLPDQKAILTREHLTVCKSSLWQLPLPRTSFYKSAPGFEQRDNFKGWLDIDLLRWLDADQRDTIKVLQTSSKIEVTDFDNL
jgi:hypothetical protein